MVLIIFCCSLVVLWWLRLNLLWSWLMVIGWDVEVISLWFNLEVFCCSLDGVSIMILVIICWGVFVFIEVVIFLVWLWLLLGVGIDVYFFLLLRLGDYFLYGLVIIFGFLGVG